MQRWSLITAETIVLTADDGRRVEAPLIQEDKLRMLNVIGKGAFGEVAGA